MITYVKISVALILSFCLGNFAIAQDIMQTVKGKVIIRISGTPLSNANIKISNATNSYGAQSDERGNYSIAVPTGRYKILISYTGYTPVEQELLVISGRESIINASLVASVNELKAVEIESISFLEEMPGQRTLSIEKTLRVPANFFDPVRVATAYPGVIAANDQANSIIVRGNSPNGLLWRLNGLDIVNPNHLANAGTLSDKPMANGGGVNILSAQMLDRTDFFTGAFPTSYGNALAGIIDMKLREGNKTKHEYTAQASLIGLDVSAEGPLGKNQNTSFLVNYRYSTVGLLSALGVNFGDEAISFQDLSFNLHHNLKKGGTLSFFGFGGNSKNEFDKKEPDEWEVDKDMYDIDFESGTYAIGMNYSTPVYKGRLSLGLAYSNSDQSREAVISDEVDPLEIYLLSDTYKLTNGLGSANVKYEASLGNANLEVGFMTNYIDNDFLSSKRTGCSICVDVEDHISGTSDGLLLQPYTNVNFTLTRSVSLNAGVRYLQYTFNNSNSLEPRVSMDIRPTEKTSVNLSYGLVSQLQLPQVYAAAGNNDLGFTKSHHLDLAYTQALSAGFNLRTGVFYQLLFDVPIESDLNSTFSAINLLEGFAAGNLVNEGTGENYGVDATLEKQFYNKNYFMIGASYYESKYTGGDNIKRNTRFNGNYTLSTVYGKEWSKPEKNRTIGLNTRLLYLGGLRQSAINVNASESGSETVYDNTNPFNEKLKDYFRIDLRLSFRKNKPHYTRTFAIDIQNLTSQQNEAYEYYDYTQQKTVPKYQLGIIPVLVYRIDF